MVECDRCGFENDLDLGICCQRCGLFLYTLNGKFAKIIELSDNKKEVVGSISMKHHDPDNYLLMAKHAISEANTDIFTNADLKYNFLSGVEDVLVMLGRLHKWLRYRDIPVTSNEIDPVELIYIAKDEIYKMIMTIQEMVGRLGCEETVKKLERSIRYLYQVQQWIKNGCTFDTDKYIYRL